MTDIRIKSQTFPFFDLPFELRSKILCNILTIPQPVDLDPNNHLAGHQRLNLFLASHRLHSEASYLFYSTHTFRIFPTHDRFFGYHGKPLLKRLPTRYREAITSLELRMGPGWTRPPIPRWVDPGLGLDEMINVRTLKVFVKCDLPHDFIRGIRKGRDRYTGLSADLFEQNIEQLPALSSVEFDGWPSVMWEDSLMKRMIEVVKEHGKTVVLMDTLDAKETNEW